LVLLGVYITDFAAMSFPAEGVEKAYRNDINDVSLVLSSRHPGKFRVYNLTERAYDYSKFGNNVKMTTRITYETCR
jgi:hypothetical protein